MYNGFFGWDDRKNEINAKKHGFDFWVGLQVFADPMHILDIDRADPITGEQRYNATGLVNAKVLITSHVYRPKPGNVKEDYIHIISSRQASRKETRRYFKQDANIA